MSDKKVTRRRAKGHARHVFAGDREPPSPPEAIALHVAATQHGVLTRRQALEAGLSASAIRTALARGRWTALRAGVYRVGVLPTPLEAEMAAVLSCRGGAVISHHTAAFLWAMLPPPKGPTEIHVTALQGRPRSGSGLRAHRSPGLTTDECTTLKGVPITNAARTILDLAIGLTPGTAERVVARAIHAGICTQELLRTMLARHPRRPGTVVLRELLAQAGEPALTRSEAESRFLDLVRAAELAPPRTNSPLEGFEVDFFWPAARLVVEIDGRAYHGDQHSFEGDRARDAALIGAGYRVQRFTWVQVTIRREVVIAQVAAALAWKRGR